VECENLDEEQAVSSLKKVVPQYLLPSNIIPVSRLPRTSSGKINYSSLKEMIALHIAQ
jgi:acyl-CoA synthetase (AMP-forming)/AMP-acid ligase II